ncbi:hypothetical protein Poli38472_006923 [Pythium oligandrum]|uniref:Cyclic nucleotide-binding domain-containing protein n=1 Tax=Pythium oligandrum TaxID=41045 RepID=A0A8K1C9S1_PYTOL|nr:hypothetical protein Poli38472_006923 [Pythium oligandrum]|eukprot:TMW58778.1 hypothetical protein Poli38472_006923 [Pythium oligandrum]
MIIYRTSIAPNKLKLATRTFRIIVALRLGHIYLNIRKRFQRHEKEYEKGFLAWLWYSRYTHLLAIGKLLWLVFAIVHYLACLRHGLIDNHTTSASATDIHESSFWSQYFLDMFNAICLLQGQGERSQTESIVANLFSILTVLLGSVLLAIVFGNVAVLVANFNANNTNYQRKLEAVVATMDKLQLPGPLCRRIHEYYTHLWSHYESLDGDISGFSRELSHTLALEVGLCRYMNLIVDVPFWKDCSPDFVMQIVLQLDVRVYLPDDFVFRQGEVGNELFMINHGTCDVYHGENTLNYRPDESSRIHSTATNDAVMPAKSCVRMQTGAVLGEMSLLMNYRRTANVLAVTHVEMCILQRETFQQLIIRYPEDRRVVLHRNLQWSIERNDKPFPWQELCEIMNVDPDPLTPAETASALLQHIECDAIDPSIQYGFQNHTTTRARYHPPPQQPQDGYGPADESIRGQVKELQRGQSAVILMIQELAANVRSLENQLTQGQGDGTRTDSVAANVFSILTVLLGSVLLAIVFGNVANFNANNTNYQRKLEAVVATMDKLHLPEPLRRRIHQYYSHLWGEYESLDGDISGFSKELSHTLALEVGFCRYMNLIVDVLFWKDCSPDFVTQIVLNLNVRVPSSS